MRGQVHGQPCPSPLFHGQRGIDKIIKVVLNSRHMAYEVPQLESEGLLDAADEVKAAATRYGRLLDSAAHHLIAACVGTAENSVTITAEHGVAEGHLHAAADRHQARVGEEYAIAAYAEWLRTCASEGIDPEDEGNLDFPWTDPATWHPGEPTL